MSLVQAAQNADSAFSEIPIIDLTEVSNPDPVVQRSLAGQVRDACINVGFFYGTNLRLHAFVELEPIFTTTSHTCIEQLDIKKTPNFKGYTAVLSSNNDPANSGDMHEGFEFGWEELDADKTANDPRRANDGVMAGANVWPSEAPGFREGMLPYYHAAVHLGKSLFPLFALALDLPSDFFDDKTRNSAAIMRALHYPPQTGPVDDRVIGIGAHTDFECFTMLWQEPGIQALQVLNANKKWIDAPPIPGTLVINLGDQFARWTNDVFRSTVHRAINRSGVRRYSIPLFFGTDYDVRLEPISSCVSEERPLHYDVVTAGEYVKARLQATSCYQIILKFVFYPGLGTTRDSSNSRRRPASMSTCGARNYQITVTALWAESILYGLYTILFAGSVYILAFQRPKRSYLAISITLYVAITASMILRLIQILMGPRTTTNSYLVDGVGYSCSSEPQSSEEIHEAWMTDLTNAIIDATNALAQIAADGLLIYRCFIIWNRKRYVVLPLATLLLATTACNLSHVYYDCELYKMVDHPSLPDTPPPRWFQLVYLSSAFNTTSNALALATTLRCSISAAARIWWVSRELGRNLKTLSGNIYKSAILMIVESGAIFSSGLIATLIVQQTAPDYSVIFTYAVNPLLGIAPTLIIVRVGMGHAFEVTHVAAFQSTLLRAGTWTAPTALTLCVASSTGSSESSACETRAKYSPVNQPNAVDSSNDHDHDTA
ncbi:hypothetical protein EVG20_g744 [Dentipellis fragilis]|uniref:Fe2OG dioxygenase domain-containing protein n=1 Tax=Dentipellis fragilis TaxID=205917 RepID=A0A4Y9ZCN6_9AGAM|nr:hypothetical protein EVG20_g744 [Dentipellis fragilis]